jgi:ribokinase
VSPPRTDVQVGVVGHVEWMEFAVTPALPRPGEILPVGETFMEAAGGGAVAAVQLRKLAGRALFVTALGDDPAAGIAREELAGRHGLELHVAQRAVPTRRGFTYLTDDHQRTITVIGERIVPAASDPLPWERCAEQDAIYFTGGDEGALRRAREARLLVATPRAFDVVKAAGVQLDVLVASAKDPGERAAAEALQPRPRHVVSPRAATAATGTRSTATRGSGVPPTCPARPWTSTAAATPSPRGSRTAWGRGWGWPTRWTSRRAAGRRA